MTELIGQIDSIDLDKKILIVKDRDGILHPYKWTTDAQQELMQKQKAWEKKGFMSVKAEGETVTGMHYMKRPDDWPANQQKPQWQKPRNEKIIVLQSSLKAAVDLFQTCTTPDTQDFETACELVVEMAIKMANALMKEGGV